MFFRSIILIFAFLVAATAARATPMSVVDDNLNNFISDTLTPAGTSFFDFRNAGLYGDCNNSGSCTKSEPLADGRNVTISASNPNTLYRDNADEFGIRGNENDEVDADEVLTIAFQGGWIPTFLGITDLFKSGDGNDDGEEVVLRGFLDDVLVFDLKGNAHDGINGGWALGSGNGEIVFRLPGVEIDFLEFHSVEASDLGNESNDEFSVALIAGQAPSEVPEPGALVLFGTALLGLGLLTRRRKQG